MFFIIVGAGTAIHFPFRQDLLKGKFDHVKGADHPDQRPATPWFVISGN
jgi:hypothetical protein